MADNMTPTKTTVPETETENTPKRSIRISTRSPKTPKCCPGCSDHSWPRYKSPQFKRNLIPQLSSVIKVQSKKSIKPTVFYKPNKNYVNPLERMLTGKPTVRPPPSIASKKQRQTKTKIGTKNKVVKKGTKKVKPTLTNIKKSQVTKKKPKAVKVVPLNRTIKPYLSLSKLKALRETASSKSPNKRSPSKSPNKNSPSKTTNRRLPSKTTNKNSPSKTTNRRSPSKIPKKVSPLKSPKKTRSISKLSKKMSATNSPKKIRTPTKSTKISPKKTRSISKLPNKSQSPKKSRSLVISIKRLKLTKSPTKSRSPVKSLKKMSPVKTTTPEKRVSISSKLGKIKSTSKKPKQISPVKKSPQNLNNKSGSPQKIVGSLGQKVKSPRKSPVKGVSPKMQLSASPRKLLGGNISRKRQAAPKKLEGASPLKKQALDSPKSRRNVISPRKLQSLSPKKNLGDSPKKKAVVASPKKSPSKTVAVPRKFFKSGPKSPKKGKIEAKKWVASLNKKGVKTKIPKSVLKSKTESSKKTGKRKSESTNNVPNKKPKIDGLVESENDRNNDLNSEQISDNVAEPATDAPLKESNSPRREKEIILFESPSLVKPPTKETTQEIVTDKDQNTSSDSLILLKENNIPDTEPNAQLINETPPKAVKLFPIFAKTAKTKSPKSPKTKSPKSPIKNDPTSPSMQRLKSLKKFSSKDSPGLKQMIIDAGQKEIGGKICQTCNMVFTIGELEDEALHARYHNKFVQRLRFNGWKSERVIGEFGDGRMILVTPEDQNYKLKKLEEIRAFVDECLGYPSVAIPDETSVYILYIAKQKIVGCLIAQQIKLAYRVLPPKENQPEMSYESMLCSTDAVPALCGISRIWTAPKFRRNKIATRMLDSLRCNFIYGHNLAINDIAFSDPSPAGRMFAANYMKCNTFLVYK